MPNNRPRCLTKGCAGKAHSRGLCPACYRVARHHIGKGIVTWDDLVDLGLALPDKRSTGSAAAFNASLLDALRKQKAKIKA